MKSNKSYFLKVSKWVLSLEKVVLPIHTAIDSSGASGLMSKNIDFKTDIEITRVRIGNLTRPFSECALYVEGADKVMRTVATGYAVPPHDVWNWVGLIRGSQFGFQVRANTGDDIFFRYWYRRI